MMFKVNKKRNTILEYNTSGTYTTLAAPGGEKATGKNYDNMATGESQPYKDNEYHLKYEGQYPNLAKLAKKLKDGAFKGNILLTGAALVEIDQLFQHFNPKKDAQGNLSLPFGDNIKLKMQGNNFFLSYEAPEKAVEPVSDNEVAGSVL